ncbi:hypothetical protein BJ684DRAFT_19870 [Piptocephalis cylindrospora]|uniref:Uncharacterized protein n=1 Tax=Piptocephalis cylindrospora TaxID=1907219 RepID=A0A4P9Y492_9FUNG|nr:hypothetical protein BJ684DRAFT_19870 [Piptocephalis cylindrospora]|eukprot:RKP13663.1 hypothetical protein BJ684DRAFT_19870 [Piptocephalis cylindrospora]
MYPISFTLLLLLLINPTITAQNITLCFGNLTCPDPLTQCYFDANGLTCQPKETPGCVASALPQGPYYQGRTVGKGDTCSHCSLPSLQSSRQLLFDPFLTQYADTSVTLEYLGNCGEGGWCDASGICQAQQEHLTSCISVEQCQGTCRRNNRAGFPTCIGRDPGQEGVEGYARLRYFGIYLGLCLGLCLFTTLLFYFLPSFRGRRSFRVTLVLILLVACAFLGYAIWWEAAPWPF